MISINQVHKIKRAISTNRVQNLKCDLISEENPFKQKDDSDKLRKYMFEDDDQYNLIDLQTDEEIRVALKFKQKLNSILQNEKFTNILSLLSCIFSIYIYFAYVVGTYYPLADFEWFDISNVAIATFFNLENAIYLYLARHKLIYILSIQTIVELFSSIYPYFYSFKNYYNQKVLEFSRICHLFRIFKYFKNVKFSENPITSTIIDIAILILVSICFFGSIFRLVEIDELQDLIINPNNRVYALSSQVKFHEFYYFVMITLFTLGYGEIYPVSEIGRVIIVCFIVYGIFLISSVTNKIFKALKGTSEYSRETYKGSKDIPYILICGSISVDALTHFCDELYHPDHGHAQKNIVILDNKEPSNEMVKFLHMSKYEMDVKYIHGNPYVENDLLKVSYTKAKVIIFFTDKYSIDVTNKKDNQNVIKAIHLKKNLFLKDAPNIPIYLQLIDSSKIIHYKNYADKYKPKKEVSNDQFIINEEIKINLISKSCLMSGLIPFISNLIRSSGSSDKTNYNWLNEYLEGFEQEIYKAELNEKFQGKTFAQISKIIYKNFDAIAFAFEIEIEGKNFIFLNPGDFVINKYNTSQYNIKYYLYLICSDKKVMNRIERADFKNNEDSDDDDEEDDDINLEKSDEPGNVGFSDNLKMGLEDILLLEDESLFNYKIHKKDDIYFFLNTNSLVPPDFKKDSIKNNPKYENHIIICGFHTKIYNYILPLRAKYLGAENIKYIVVLAQNLPKKLWDSISKFEKIILINGSPHSMDDLHRANIEFASKVIILEDIKIQNNKKNFSKKLIDKNRTLTYQTIKKANPKIQVIVELAFETNIEYLLDEEELANYKKNKNYSHTSLYSSGEVFFNSIVDSLTAQAYYNKHIVTIIHQLLIDGNTSGNSPLLKISENFGLKSSNFWQTKIPEKFIGKTFGDLYEEFCDNNLIILALYRLPYSTDNIKGYVYTKPVEDTFLKKKDKVFVLGEKEILFNYYKTQMEKEKKIDDRNIFKFDEDDKKAGLELNEEENEEINKYSPFSYMKEKTNEIEKEINKVNKTMIDTKAAVKETISNGIKQEISYLLQ